MPLPSPEGDHIHPSLLKTVLDFSHSPSVTVNSIPFYSQNHLNLEDKFSVNLCDSYSTSIYYLNRIGGGAEGGKRKEKGKEKESRKELFFLIQPLEVAKIIILM